MAEAIGRHLVLPNGSGKPDQSPINIFSAGTHAMSGAPATAEAILSVEKLGIMMHQHRSTSLTAEMVRGADVVFAMAHGHLQAIVALAPEAKARIELLDPEGNDIPDPLGYPQHVYDETARAILEAIQSRLRSLDVELGQ